MRLQLASAAIDDLAIHDVTRINDPTFPYQLRSAKRTIVPRRVEQTRTNRHGINDYTKPWFGAQTIDIAGYVWAPTDLGAEDAYDALTQRLTGEGTHVFKFRRLGRAEDEQAIVTLGAIDDPEAKGYSRTIKYAATLIGADPRVYTAALKGGSYDPTVSLSGGGVAMPLTFPLTFSTTTATELFVTNAGNAKTPPTFTIKGPVAAPIIDNDTTGESFYINYTLGASDTIVVDMGARTLTLNGALRRDLVIVSGTTWFSLVPGQNALRLRGTGMAAGVTSLAVRYRDARN